MNVCICTSSFPANRTEVFHRYLVDLINILHSNGHTVTVLTQNRRSKKELFIPNAEVVWFPWKMTTNEVLAEVSFKAPANLLSTLSLIYNGIRYSKRIEKEKKIDIFLCLWIVPSGLYIYLKNIFGKRTPYILWSHGSDIYQNKDNFFSRLLLRLIIKKAKAVFANGYKLSNTIEKIADRECKFLPVFHDSVEVPIDSDTPPNINLSSLKTFLFIGRLTAVKGADILIESLKLLNSESDSIHTNFKCYIIGDGEMKAELVNEVNENRLNEKVVFLGKIMDEKLKAKYFNLADCVIIPSRSESIPIVLSESVFYEKPVIVTNVGDMEFLVNKYNLGLVAEKENAYDVAEKIKIFCAQPITITLEDRDNLLNILSFKKNARILLEAIEKN